jgi:hypothetical protein
LRLRSACQRIAASPSSSHFKTGSVGMGNVWVFQNIRIANALQLATDPYLGICADSPGLYAFNLYHAIWRSCTGCYTEIGGPAL